MLQPLYLRLPAVLTIFYYAEPTEKSSYKHQKIFLDRQYDLEKSFANFTGGIGPPLSCIYDRDNNVIS